MSDTGETQYDEQAEQRAREQQQRDERDLNERAQPLDVDQQLPALADNNNEDDNDEDESDNE